ncbi:MAG: hypothetical protein Q8R79_03380 [Legionellaceae bacterium]|nr:hypothetical protein [Legionellaceae bacterium]
MKRKIRQKIKTLLLKDLTQKTEKSKFGGMGDGGVYRDGVTGKDYLVKRISNSQGVKDHLGQIHVASSFLQGMKDCKKEQFAQLPQTSQDQVFVSLMMHCWLGNRDILNTLGENGCNISCDFLNLCYPYKYTDSVENFMPDIPLIPPYQRIKNKLEAYIEGLEQDPRHTRTNSYSKRDKLLAAQLFKDALNNHTLVDAESTIYRALHQGELGNIYKEYTGLKTFMAKLDAFKSMPKSHHRQSSFFEAQNNKHEVVISLLSALHNPETLPHSEQIAMLHQGRLGVMMKQFEKVTGMALHHYLQELQTLEKPGEAPRVSL